MFRIYHVNDCLLQQGSHRPLTPPRCCHLGSYFKCPKSSPMRPLACNWYYCTVLAKPKAACALPFRRVPTSSNLGLWANMTSSIHKVSLRRQRRCSSEDMIADRQTDTHMERQTDTLITILCSPIGCGVKMQHLALMTNSSAENWHWLSYNNQILSYRVFKMSCIGILEVHERQSQNEWKEMTLNQENWSRLFCSDNCKKWIENSLTEAKFFCLTCFLSILLCNSVATVTPNVCKFTSFWEGTGTCATYVWLVMVLSTISLMAGSSSSSA